MSKSPGKSAGKSKIQSKAAAAKPQARAKPVKSVAKPSLAKAAPVKAAPLKSAPKPSPQKPVAPKAAVPPPFAPKSGAPKNGAPKNGAPKNGAPKNGAPKSGPKDVSPRTIATAKQTAPTKTESVPKKMAARAKAADVVLPPDYRPSDSEPFMNEMHRAYFRKRLLDWKDDILRQTRETLAILHEDSTQHADIADRATSETDRATELRTRDRQRKLIAKIDAAIGRIDDGSYGFCEDTGEPIGLKRLDARPIATLSVEAQERHERREKVYREE
jgi:DnaK suppressor protein